ncbi:aspartate ammonia-lyase [Pseudovibrio flavus]|uniref:aspartate ammonia-lyase n=1 Tax=Pseudovibrio flavus TaxID=2529854 RepID=UPI00211BE010|nr:aspartate ammonia-lyase [Pseudovibrio flavus]
MRTEKDLLGTKDIPDNAYWGVHTARAVENFPISGVLISQYPEFIRALAMVKKSAAKANRDLDILEAGKATAIIAACERIIGGEFIDQFVIDVIQGGAGTSTNMNANEVIANVALEGMGFTKGEYTKLNPVDDVNRSQSTNDVYPTAIKLGVILAAQNLLADMAMLQDAFAKKADEFSDVMKIGRTQLQDAVPMTVGQEFRCYEVMLGEDILRLEEALKLLLEINLGATAIGTGINSDPEYSKRACEHLADLSGFPFVPAGNLVEATQDLGSFVQLSGVLKRIAVKISKVCNDLRLLSSGPQAGLGEINLPPRAAGSSIMPGKVNPVIPEVVNQIAFEVIGNDVTITMAAEGGQLQLNAFEPIIVHSLFKSIMHLSSGFRTLAKNCVEGITVNREHLARVVESSASLGTALNPYIGYENASVVIKTALRENRSIREVILEHGFLDEQELELLLQPELLTKPSRKIDLAALKAAKEKLDA